MPELFPFTLMILYLIPFLVAAGRNHDMLLPILIANVLVGWTVIGWIVLLAVAVVAPVDSTHHSRRV
jgi:hypothetical protein